jgi:hypothetical protein
LFFVDKKISIKNIEKKYPAAKVFKPSIKLVPLIKTRTQKAVKIKETNLIERRFLSTKSILILFMLKFSKNKNKIITND